MRLTDFKNIRITNPFKPKTQPKLDTSGLPDIEKIDPENKIVYYDDGTQITHADFIKKYIEFFKGRIAGETITHADMSRFIQNRTSSKNLTFLMKGKKMEGVLEASTDKILSRGAKIALGTIITIVMVAVIALVILRGQGII